MRISEWSSDVCSSDLIKGVGGNALAESYAAEHRAFLLGATGRTDDAMAAFQPLITGETGRATRIRLVAAAMLQRKGRKEEAAALLTGRDQIGRAACRERVCQTCRYRW